MEPTKTILLIQGGHPGISVAKHLLQSNYKVKCLMDQADSPKAKELQQLGVEIIQGNLEDRQVLENAMKNIYGLYCYLDYFDYKDEIEKEHQLGCMICDVAKQANVKHIVLVSMESVEKLTGGKLKIPHFDGKAKVAEHCKNNNLPYTEIIPAFYMENFLKDLKPRKETDGSYTFVLPLGDKPLDLISIEDLGGIVAKIFDNPEQWMKKSLGVAGDSLTGFQIADTFAKCTNKKAKFENISVDDYKKMDIPNADKLASMFQFYCEFAGKLKDIKQSRELYPQMKTFEDWLKIHSSAFA